MDVGLAGAVVAALHRVVEEAVRRVVVVAVVLGGVDATLRSDRVGTTRRVLVAEVQDVVARFTERRGRGTTGEAGADDDDRELAAVRGVHETSLELARRPDLVDFDVRRLGVGDLFADRVVVQCHISHSNHAIHPKSTARGMIMKPK